MQGRNAWMALLAAQLTLGSALVIGAATISGSTTGHGDIAPSQHGYSTCDKVNAPELCPVTR